MIRIQVERNEQAEVERILVTGHANYAEPGKDIICAAVSGISIGMVNAIEKMFGVKVHADDDGEGKVDCRLPENLDDPEKAAKIRLLMEAMAVSLKSMADEYPSYVRMKER
ncbi:ribosomal-processing cysteine protease Prp [Paenactinomyces guangxiensis]|uniref:Ribosomal processing cysteine protease Prp n=1 Tax=Paenactinomyces guangxiensis TaxID=1490290 RepID=A0A7W1WUB3_9BACL|nr:ribosomal-processing cysteine protease Prp [Paenactinomyces guangxiensis]MBA4496162.1 ribosomal-processing cysteine protease Prp [Paenactinomyces guangxiensis]MBH8593250.1 ribosomal-processing cysteine protease Prp [Paenactinomyces guangxiensis]